MGYNSSDFYNPEIKQKFLNEKDETVRGTYKRLFATLKQDEERYNSDFCDFNYDTLMNVLSNRLSRGRSSKNTQLSLLRNYVAWCIAERIKKSDENPIKSLRTIDIDSSVQIRRQFLRDPEHLQKILNTVLKSETDEDANGVMYRMSCWLLYEGFTEDEVLELRESNVDFGNKTLTSPSGDRVIAVSDTLIKLIKQAIDLEYTVRQNPHGGVNEYELEDSDRLFRKIKRKDSTRSKQPLRVKLSRLRNKYASDTYESISLASNRIWLSGLFYRLYQKEKSVEGLTVEDFYYNLNGVNTRDSINAKIKNNQRDYADWKKAYSLI